MCNTACRDPLHIDGLDETATADMGTSATSIRCSSKASTPAALDQHAHNNQRNDTVSIGCRVRGEHIPHSQSTAARAHTALLHANGSTGVTPKHLN